MKRMKELKILMKRIIILTIKETKIIKLMKMKIIKIKITK